MKTWLQETQLQRQHMTVDEAQAAEPASAVWGLTPRLSLPVPLLALPANLTRWISAICQQAFRLHVVCGTAGFHTMIGILPEGLASCCGQDLSVCYILPAKTQVGELDYTAKEGVMTEAKAATHASVVPGVLHSEDQKKSQSMIKVASESWEWCPYTSIARLLQPWN